MTVLVLALMLGAQAASAAPQTRLAPTPTEPGAPFRESFDAERKVTTGSSLVGLAVGAPDGFYEPERAVLPAAELDDDSIVCVRQASRDGRYASANPYGLTSGADAGGPLVVSPLTQSYGDMLGTTDARDIGFLAFVTDGPACPTADALYLPRLRVPGGALQALVASRTRAVSVWLTGPDASVAGRCEAVPRPAVAFDVRCTVPLEDAPNGEAQLHLSFDDGFSVTQQHYRVQLPNAESR